MEQFLQQDGSFYRRITATLRAFSLKTLLIISFIVIITGTVGLTGYLSFHNGQIAINELAGQLQDEIAARTQQHLENYLALPHLINQINLDSIALRQIDLQDFNSLERHFWNQLQRFEQVSSIAYANEEAGYIGPFRTSPGGAIELAVSGSSTDYVFETYALDEQGNRTGLASAYPDYDPRVRPWYQAAVNKGQPAWTPIFVWTTGDIGTDAVVPVFGTDNELSGVLDVSLTLGGISTFLAELEVGSAGEIFIIDRSGMLVASSTTEAVYVEEEGEVRRLSALDSQLPLIQQTASYLTDDTNGMANIDAPQRLSLEVDGQPYLLSVTPFYDAYGLDWLIVIALAEADLMAQINAHSRTTVILIFLSLAVAMGTAVLVSRWITQPILHLNQSAKALTQGDWDQQVLLNRADEVGELADSFNHMARQLQRTFATLQVNEEKYRTFYQDNPSMFFTVNKEGTVVSVNDFGASQLGYSIDELEGQPVLNVFHPEDKTAVAAQLEKCLQNTGQTFSWQFRKVCQDGRVIWVQEHARAIQDAQETTQVLIVCEDITERKRLDDNRRAQQRFLASLNDITRAALETDDLQTMLQTLVERLTRLFVADAVILTLWDRVGQTMVPVTNSVVKEPAAFAADPFGLGKSSLIADLQVSNRALAVGDLCCSPYAALHGETGPYRAILGLPLIAGNQQLGAALIQFSQPRTFTPSQIARGEQTAGLIALALAKARLLGELEHRVAKRTRELTEANERLQELDRLKDQFVANVSHDLRTPLSNIRLYLGLLRRQGAAGLERNVPILEREAKRLTHLIEDLLTLSRLEHGDIAFTLEPQILDRLLDEVCQAHAVWVARKGLHLVHEPNPETPAVPVDYAQMMEVFTNLVANAIAYTPEGGQIRCVTSPVLPVEVVVAFSNTGPPIPQEDIPHIFDRFYRGQTGQGSGESGSGLGLAICKEIVERHGGKIEVESLDGQATTFQVRLPLNAG